MKQNSKRMILYKTLLLSFLLTIYASNSMAKVIHLLPKPQYVHSETSTKSFSLNRKIQVKSAVKCWYLEQFLNNHKVKVDSSSSVCIEVLLVDSIKNTFDYELSGYENESYSLKVQANKITIKAVSQVGVIRAVQTLEQLSEGTPNNSLIECVEIVDYPAFKLRGFMHDTGRSYISIEDLKTQIRLLSRFKINTFHWHLTENQAWRFEVKAYPQLTHATAMTRHKGLFYTQEECTSLEKYAKMHGITIIPEIDMPGHSDAFVRAMGHDMQTDEGMKELKVILKEVAQTFPNAPFIHIGADEKRIVYPHFIKEIAAYIHQLGRKCVIWMPIQGEFSDVDMTQLWSTAGKMVKGIPNIDCRYNYINHFDVFADIVGIYKSNIYYQPKGNANLAGSVVALWNDHKLSSTKDMLMQNNFYASVLATAEHLWIGGGKEYIEKGGTMLPIQGDEFESFRDWERRFIFHKKQSLSNEPIPYVKQTNIKWLITEPIPSKYETLSMFLPQNYNPSKAIKIADSVYSVHECVGGGIYLRHTWGKIVPSLYSDAKYGNMVFASTRIYSPTKRTVGALIELQNYSRSEHDLAPPKGAWDYKGSKIWINNKEIMPPNWIQCGIKIDNETNLLDANFTGRKPVRITLEKGWNKVLIKLPYKETKGIRLNKWMFTFVITELSGKEALSDIIYNPYH